MINTEIDVWTYASILFRLRIIVVVAVMDVPVPPSGLLLPLLVLIVPLGRDPLHWVDPHVKHPLQLLLLVLWGEGVRHRAVHCGQHKWSD